MEDRFEPLDPSSWASSFCSSSSSHDLHQRRQWLRGHVRQHRRRTLRLIPLHHRFWHFRWHQRSRWPRQIA